MSFSHTVGIKNKSILTMPGWDSPLCLIETAGGSLSVNADTLAQLEKVPAPLVVVGVAGLYRTGKSYIMNLLAGNPKGWYNISSGRKKLHCFSSFICMFM